jgi:hypothetical protein
VSEDKGWWVIVRDGGSFTRKWFATQAEADADAAKIERGFDRESVACGIANVSVYEVGKL